MLVLAMTTLNQSVDNARLAFAWLSVAAPTSIRSPYRVTAAPRSA